MDVIDCPIEDGLSGPRVPQELFRMAHDAGHRGAHDQALLIWERLRLEAPQNERSWIGSLNTLFVLRLDSQAARIADEMERRFPNNGFPPAMRARLAMRSNEWNLAETCWRSATSLEPSNPIFRGGLVTLLIHLGRRAEAEREIDTAPPSSAQHSSLRAARATLAERSGKWSAAIAAWQSYIESAPDSVMGVAGLSRSLCGARRFSEADNILAKARADFPLDIGIAVASAHVAEASQAWRVAQSRWESVLRLAPQHPTATAKVEECKRQSNQEKSELVKILDKFVSLGRNCEFGLLQKSFGSESPGLLRWASTRPEVLLQGLRNKFARLGDEATTEIFSEGEEFIVRDRCYGFLLHTFINVSAGSADSIFRKQCRRTRILVDKLVDQLRAGRKIFVYQHPELNDELAVDIYDALREYGSGVLLCVRTAGGSPAGRVRLLRPMLMVCEIEREGAKPDGSWNICTENWLEICQDAHALLIKQEVEND